MVVLFKSDKIGEGELGAMMATKFTESIKLNAKADKNLLPESIFFLNRGVLLCAKNDGGQNIQSKNDGAQNTQSDNQEIISHLKELESMGAKIICCESCLDFFGIKSLAVGEKGNSMDIVKNLLSQKVLSI